MKALQTAYAAQICALSLCLGCSTPSEAPATPPPSAGGQSAGGQSAGGQGAGGSGGATAAAGSAGSGGVVAMGGVTGSAGSSGSSGAGGSGGSAGGAPDGCEELGSPGKTGRQCDPTEEGNGTHDHPQPDSDTPPEAEGDAAGMLTGQQTFQSTVFGYGFNYRIYVPTQYEAGKPAALMVFQDGSNYLDNFNVPTVVDNLIESGEMPVTIVLFIQPGGQRSEEYDTRSDKYPNMLVNEMIPGVIESDYDIVDDPNGWAIGGHSSGGSCAFNAAWFFPDKFRKVHTNNGSFIHMQDPSTSDYIQMVLDEEKKPLRVTLLSGENDLVCCGDTWFNANNKMAENLATAGYAYRYMTSDSSHDVRPYSTSDFPDAMRWLWRGYTLPHYAAAP